MLLGQVLKCVFIICLFNEIYSVDFSNKWTNVIDRSTIFYKTISKSDVNFITKQSKQYNDDVCYNDTITFYEGIDHSSEWAVKMYDSWGNSPSGILAGNSYNIGNFDECINVGVSTQYCLLEIVIDSGNSSVNLEDRSTIVKPEIVNFLHPIEVLVGTCYPSSCSPDLTAALYKIYLNLDEFDVLVHPSNIKCHIGDQNSGFEFTPMQIFTIFLFSLIALLIVSSTVVELFVEIKETFVVLKIWKAFSAYENLPIICDTQVNGNDGENKFACLDGLRAISIVWVAYGHSVVNTQRSPLINGEDIIAWSENLWTIISWSTFNFAVDTFFVIGGFLAARSIRTQFEKNQRPYAYKFLSIPRMWFHRYIRLAPVVISAVLFFTTIGTQLGRGPFWENTMQEIELCNNNWWSTILFVQNYASAGKMCLGHLWYLAVDLQMFILTTILIFLIHWKGVRYLSIALVMIVVSIGNNIYWYIANDYQWVNSKEPELNQRNAVTYYPTHARMGSWIVGVILAIIYSKYLKKKDETVKIPSKLLFIGYVYCAVTVGLIVAIISFMTNRNVRASTVLNALFDSFSRLMWATMIAFIIFKCITRNGGPVDKLLSSPIWKPLSKLSFCIYVLHYVVQLLKIGQNRTMVYMDNISLIERFWSDFGISVTVSVFWTLAFEMPFRIIERINFNRPKDLTTITNQSYVNHGLQVES